MLTKWKFLLSSFSPAEITVAVKIVGLAALTQTSLKMADKSHLKLILFFSTKTWKLRNWINYKSIIDVVIMYDPYIDQNMENLIIVNSDV